jgi:putative chitinase
MIVTADQLMQVMPQAGARRVNEFVAALDNAYAEWEIDSRLRVSHFLAQLAAESIQLTYTAEIASGVRYEGRADLGNTQPGDGMKFKGRGLIQVTGRANYTACAKALNLPLLDHPELLELPIYAASSAGWFWKTHGCNELADHDDLYAVTRRVNGGLNNIADRSIFYNRARKAIV